MGILWLTFCLYLFVNLNSCFPFQITRSLQTEASSVFRLQTSGISPFDTVCPLPALSAACGSIFLLLSWLKRHFHLCYNSMLLVSPLAPSFHALGPSAQVPNPVVYQPKMTFHGPQAFLSHAHHLSCLNHLILGAFHETHQIVHCLQVRKARLDTRPLHGGT